MRLRGAYVIRCVDVIRDPENGQVVRLHCVHDEATLGKKPVGYKAAGVIHWVSAEHGVPVTLRRFGSLFSAADAQSATPQLDEEEKEDEEEGQASPSELEKREHSGSPSRAEPELELELLQQVNPNSLEEFEGAIVEPSVLEAVRNGSSSGSETTRRCWYQFEREGYYVLDERLDADGGRCEESVRITSAHGDDSSDRTGDGELVFNMVVGLRQGKAAPKKKQSSAQQGEGKGKGKGKGKKTRKSTRTPGA